ncbi:MAG: rRNA maturation RNase YbeY [Candidatus Staskawiczbacteria bacterium RIFOXYD1_FULL_39_28]|uniref:Endoribonuclease YbeY n=1 Tax=Candidatus Staskawiczbacteria bacterium RIFOXYC1_FULL_38_18 TaxID=1802229 RepID=A0A1G2JC12_9BACT|nr:MAG: rRNA maturation RNase YbeY [Candidatus Staskawiczbacteria bacterium RIFOXYC1_FULL_38_18]OGZ91427.1 MAG: rRNA maturation RNase YbeY [Candidatus Staskawiczbacteria bacterium RIFOXYD1_FULL_39_28]
MIEINNITKFIVDKKSFAQVAKKVLLGENRETETLSLVFVSREEIKKLNKKFRKKNRATDVLSFNLNEPKHLGEIVICPDVVKENARKIGVSAKSETMKVFIHGILHLLGYDHEKDAQANIMEAKQNLYLSSIK